jgi:uncharacterized protein YbbC (DUF1343 family)
VCYGYNLQQESIGNKIELKWLLNFYNTQKTNTKSKSFFNSFFTKLAGTKKLQKQIEEGLKENEIRKTWEGELNEFKKIRNSYLLYE